MAEIHRGLADLENGGSAPERLLAKAWAAEAEAQIHETATLLSRAVAEQPNDPFVALEAAKARLATNAADGIAGLDSVTRRFPRFAPAFMTLAYALQRRGDTARAIVAAERYRDLAPEQPYSHYVLARLQGELRQHGAVAQRLARVRKDPTGAHPFLHHAFAAQHSRWQGIPTRPTTTSPR